MRDVTGRLIIDGKTQLYGLVGNPVEHSFSPFIHNFLFEYYGLNKVYAAFDVNSNLDNLADGISVTGIRGLNITSPFKEEAVKSMHWASARARMLGSVNTVKNINGKLFGFNTDFFGVLKSLQSHNVDLKGKKALVFGGGPIARTILYVLEHMEAQSVTLLNRTPEKARTILNSIKKRRISSNYGELNSRCVNEQINNVDIVINATSIDVMGPKGTFLDLEKARRETVFFDVLYKPQTKFITLADKAGFKAISGLEMLIWQALKSFQVWTGIWPKDGKSMLFETKEHLRKLTE